MAQKRKLQVFVSSTYEDLKADRQAAVEAILTAGHIPAGMELFTAGDEAQMNVIKRWIDESDVYVLILGGRYGSVEPKSKKSYTQLEYEYAVQQNKPLFAVVIKEDYLESRVKAFGSHVKEGDNPQKLAKFRSLVRKNMVEFWGDPRDIELSIIRKLAEFDKDESLRGWIPGGENVNSAALTEELRRLSKENADLRELLSTFQQPVSSSRPVPKFEIEAKISNAYGTWYDGSAIPTTMNGEWLEISITNRGSLIDDIEVSLSGTKLFDYEQVSRFPSQQKSIRDPAHNGWKDIFYDDEIKRHTFQGKVGGFRPGRIFNFVLPVHTRFARIDEESGGESDHEVWLQSEDKFRGSIVVDVFPTTGSHAQRIFPIATLLEGYDLSLLDA